MNAATKHLLSWKAGLASLDGIGRRDLASDVLEGRRSVTEVAAIAGGDVDRRLGWGDAVRFASSVETLLYGDNPQTIGTLN